MCSLLLLLHLFSPTLSPLPPSPLLPLSPPLLHPLYLFLVSLSLSFFLLFWDKIFLCSLSCPKTCYVDQASFEFTEIHLPVSRVLRLNASTLLLCHLLEKLLSFINQSIYPLTQFLIWTFCLSLLALCFLLFLFWNHTSGQKLLPRILCSVKALLFLYPFLPKYVFISIILYISLFLDSHLCIIYL